MLRVIRVVRYYEPLEIIVAVVRRQSKILWTVFSLAIFYIFITALIMFNAEEEINPNTGNLLFNNFFDAFYWAACTLTTVGYGDISPTSFTGRCVAVVLMLLGIGLIGSLTGSITTYFTTARAGQEPNTVKSDADDDELSQIIAQMSENDRKKLLEIAKILIREDNQ